MCFQIVHQNGIMKKHIQQFTKVGKIHARIKYILYFEARLVCGIYNVISLHHSMNGDFCGHSRFVLWHENITTFVSWTLAKSESWGGGWP